MPEFKKNTYINKMISFREDHYEFLKDKNASKMVRFWMDNSLDFKKHQAEQQRKEPENE